MPRGPRYTCAQVWLFPISVEGIAMLEVSAKQRTELSGNACDFLVGSLILWRQCRILRNEYHVNAI